jgi:hypothetical protein
MRQSLEHARWYENRLILMDLNQTAGHNPIIRNDNALLGHEDRSAGEVEPLAKV